MKDTFLPTMHNEETGEEITYRAGFFFQMRDTGLYNSEEIMVAVLADIHDAMREHPELFDADRTARALETYELACADVKQAQDTGEYDAVDWLNDATFYPPTGVDVDWNGDAGTVLVTVDAGWPTFQG